MDPSRLSGPDAPQTPRLVHRNIRVLLDLRRRFELQKSRADRFADAITSFTGSIPFVVLHAVVFGGWIVLNLNLVPGVRAFDPFPFVMLAMVASVEAIFLSTFVLISQNRMQALAEQRAELDLQINLLAEHEVTRLVRLVDAIGKKLGVEDGLGGELEELERDVAPEALVDAIERGTRRHPPPHSH